jgi:Tol biopolymer transport system component
LNKYKGEGMRNRMMIMVIVGIMLLVVGCRVEYSETNTIMTPAWKDDGKVLYVKRYTRYKTTYNTLGEDCVIVADTFYLMKCDSDGNNKEELFPIRGKVLSLNSSGEWITISTISDTGGIYVMKLDGSGLQLLGEGLYPDLSPDGGKIVYAKRNEGIWIMNRDGSGDHKIVSDTTASYPAWSPDDTLIAYISFYSPYSTIIITNNGTKTDSFTKTYFYDWGGIGTNLIYCGLWSGKDVSIDLSTGQIDSTNIIQNIYRCSRNGEYFICEDSNYYVIKDDGTNKHYIEP